MMDPPIFCDLCHKMVNTRSQVWTCENGRRTVLHAVAYDVCESCFMLHAHGVEVIGAGTEAASAEDDEEDCSEMRDSLMEDDLEHGPMTRFVTWWRAAAEAGTEAASAEDDEEDCSEISDSLMEDDLESDSDSWDV